MYTRNIHRMHSFAFFVGGPAVTLREDVPAVVALSMAKNWHGRPSGHGLQLVSGLRW